MSKIINFEPLKNIVSLQNGYAFKSNFFCEDANPVIKIKNLNSRIVDLSNLDCYPDNLCDNLDKFLLKNNDVLLSMTGASCGNVSKFLAKDGKKYYLNQRVGRFVSVNDDLDMEYFFQLMSSDFYKNIFFNSSEGSAQPNILFSNISEVKIPLPPLHEQQKIASVLSALDDQIELNNKINRELEDFAQTLYNYWFIQFEFPNEEGKPYKSSGGKMAWNEELKREIPEGWEVKNVLELVNWIGGTQPPKSEHIYEWREGYIRFIQNRDYQDNSHITYIKQTSTNKVCNEFDILMDKYGEAGKVRFGIAGAYNVALAKLEVINPDSREYIRSFFNDKNILEYLKNASIASTRASLNAQTLETIKVCYPTKDLLCKFETIAAQSIATILQNRQQNQELTQLRDYLLPLLMNGQVTVSDEMFQE